MTEKWYLNSRVCGMLRTETDRDRKPDRDRQTDRQTDRQIDREGQRRGT